MEADIIESSAYDFLALDRNGTMVLTLLMLASYSVAFATAEAQEALGYGNWLKDTGMSDGWYNGLMAAVNIAAIAVNISP